MLGLNQILYITSGTIVLLSMCLIIGIAAISRNKTNFYKGYCVILSLIEIRLRCRGGLDSITSWTIAITKEDTISKHFGFIKSKNVNFFFYKNLSEVCFVYIRCMICRLNKPNRSRFETIRFPFPNTSMTHCYVISSPKVMTK